MPRVHKVEKARKPQPQYGIEIGDTYYWWEFRYGGKRVSKTYPKPPQLTQSAFLGTLYDIQETVEKLDPAEGLEDSVNDIAQQLRDVGQECQDSLDNMPEGLQQGDTGQMLQERVDACEAAADEFDSIDFSHGEFKDEDAEEPAEGQDDQTEQEFWEEKLEEVQGVDLSFG